ncbi:ABC transporter substrate-binding protein [Pyrodictium abyssi]|uniref:ABC transporter substrate-binding protein n=1 Tax=Pyrodictium abyssi TaxID=54256 RepID=A0ABM8IU74_9CREN|nr:ABC transporter substrate-binding protein [Pyrodictium abyssi]
MASMKPSIGLIAAIVVVIALIAGVMVLKGGEKTTTETATTQATSPAAGTAAGGASGGEIKIGVILPLSGRLAETGADLKHGIEFAVEQINSMGGVKSCGGAKLVVVYGDSAGKPEVGAAEAERLITQEKVVALVGAYQSAVTKTASEVAERYHVPFLNPDSTSPALTQRGYKWFFRTTPHDAMFAEQQAEFIKWLNEKYNLGLKTYAIIHEDSEWGTKVAEAWKKYFDAAGFKLVKEISYHAATVTSLDAEVKALKAANPDILLVASYVQDAILLVQAMKANNFAPKVVLAQDAGFISPSYVQQVGKDGWFIMSREVFNWDLMGKIPRLKQVNEEYKKKYGVDLNGNSARDYTGIWVLYYALEEACKKASPDNLEEFRAALRDALASLEIPADKLIVPWKGVKFDENGQNILGQGIIVQMMEDGKYHTIYPPEYATAEPKVPFPPWNERS